MAGDDSSDSGGMEEAPLPPAIAGLAPDPWGEADAPTAAAALTPQEAAEQVQMTHSFANDPRPLRISIARGNIRLSAAAHRAWKHTTQDGGPGKALEWCPADKQRGVCGAGDGCPHAHVVPRARADVDALFSSMHPEYERACPVKGASRGSLHHDPKILAASVRTPVNLERTGLIKIHPADLRIPKGNVLLRATLTTGRLTGACCVLPKTLLYLTDDARKFIEREHAITWCYDDREKEPEGCDKGENCRFAHVLPCDKARVRMTLKLPQAVAKDPPVLPEDSDEEVFDTAGRPLQAVQSALRAGGEHGEAELPAPDVPPNQEVRLKSDIGGRLNAGEVIVLARDLQMSRKVKSVYAQRGWASWCAEDKMGLQCRLGERGSCGFSHVNSDVRTKVRLLFNDVRARTPNPPKLHGGELRTNKGGKLFGW